MNVLSQYQKYINWDNNKNLLLAFHIDTILKIGFVFLNEKCTHMLVMRAETGIYFLESSMAIC